jgi:stalled ribosome rescue protein Dom34
MKVHNDHHHFHRNSDSLGSRRERDRTYFAAVADALGEIPEILILGPGTARTEFVSWLEEHRPTQVKHVLGNQACGDVADEAVMERAHSFFRAADRMLPAG